MRPFAYLFDLLLVYLVYALVVAKFLPPSVVNAPFNYVLMIMGWLYFSIHESSSRQATQGKALFGIKVTDTFGNRISFLRATGRYFAKYLSMIIVFVGFVMAAFTARKQALHDLIASTLVLDK